MPSAYALSKNTSPVRMDALAAARDPGFRSFSAVLLRPSSTHMARVRSRRATSGPLGGVDGAWTGVSATDTQAASTSISPSGSDLTAATQLSCLPSTFSDSLMERSRLKDHKKGGAACMVVKYVGRNGDERMEAHQSARLRGVCADCCEEGVHWGVQPGEAPPEAAAAPGALFRASCLAAPGRPSCLAVSSCQGAPSCPASPSSWLPPEQ